MNEMIYFMLGFSLSVVLFMVAYIYFYVQHKNWIKRHEQLTSNLSRLIKEVQEKKR